jgi:hypothetical protein
VAQLTARISAVPARGGEPVLSTPYRSAKKPTCDLSATLTAPPGIYSMVIAGEVVYDDGHEEPFSLRSRPVTILSDEQFDELQARLVPPRFEGDDPRVGVVSGGYGSDAILNALHRAPVEALPVYRVTPAHLAPCQAVAFTQRRSTAGGMTANEIAALRAFVRDGGGLLVTHDAVGIRGHEALFPQIATGVTPPLRETEVRIADAEHSITAGLEAGAEFTHSYYDHIPLEAGETSTVLVTNSRGQAVVACGEAGEGRYVAWGMVTGLGPGGAEVQPRGIERELLLNTVRWLAEAH